MSSSDAIAQASGTALVGVRRTLAIASVLAAMTLAVLDAGMVNVALPHLARAFDITPADAILVITAYQAGLAMALLPLGARPHWGKCFAATADDLGRLYPRWEDFRALRASADPDGKFGNAFLDRVLG